MNEGRMRVLAGVEPSGHRLLIVDDNPTNLAVLSDYLKEFGFVILTARDGETALKRAELASPDLILLDVMMPGLNGFETCQRLQAKAETKNIPIIFMTALSETSEKVKGFSVGAVDYITKPFQQEEVLARVATHLKIRSLTLALRDSNAKLTQRNLHLEAAARLSQRITSILHEEELLPVVVQLIQSQFGFLFTGIWLVHENEIVLRIGMGRRREGSIPEGSRVSVKADEEALVAVFQTGRQEFLEDVEVDPRSRFTSYLPDAGSELLLPMKIGDDVLGILDLYAENPDSFQVEDRMSLQTLADQVAIALRNARLFQLVEQHAHDLEEANAAKDKFLSIVAHDLRSPFMPVLGFANQLYRKAETVTPQDVRRSADRILRSAQSVHDLLDNLLHWSRLQLGRFDPAPAMLDLHAAVETIFTLFSGVAENKGISLENAAPANTYVVADENMITAVMRNLVSNGLKFTPVGGRVTIRASRCSEDSQWVEISVEDTGLGIPESDLPRLLRGKVPFSTPGTAQERGTGLGLIICQELVAKNGGRLSIDSQVSRGTSVKFTVPSGASSSLASVRDERPFSGAIR